MQTLFRKSWWSTQATFATPTSATTATSAATTTPRRRKGQRRHMTLLRDPAILAVIGAILSHQTSSVTYKLPPELIWMAEIFYPGVIVNVLRRHAMMVLADVEFG